MPDRLEEAASDVVGSSLLWGTEAPICWPEPLATEVCCLLRAHIQDVVERLPKLVRLSAVLPCGHQRDLQGQPGEDLSPPVSGGIFRGVRSQVLFSSALLVGGEGIRRRGLVLSINNCVQSWGQQHGFGFCHHPVLFEDKCLLGEMGSTSLSGGGDVVILQIHIVK